jgi:hypothetical protein
VIDPLDVSHTRARALLAGHVPLDAVARFDARSAPAGQGSTLSTHSMRASGSSLR